MKVMFLTNIPSPYRVNFFNELSNYCDLTVVFEKKQSAGRDAKWISDENIGFKTVFLDGIRIKNRIVYSKKLKEFAKQEWDIVILGVYMITPAIYLNHYFTRKKKPFLIQADGGLIKDDRWLMGKLKRSLISKAAGWITSGPKTTEYFVYYGADRTRCYEYPFSSIRNKDVVESMQVRRARTEKAREALGIRGKKMVLAVGRFIQIKGFDVLIKAVPQLSDNIDVYFVGGVPGEEYKKICKDFQLKNVYFEGFKTKDELALYYEAADIFVLPTRGDVWGLVINEAMGYGLPVVTTNNCVAGVELIKNGENGYLVKTDDVGSLADAINRILEDDSLCELMSTRNIEKIKGYTIETMAMAHKQIFEQFLNESEQ